MGNKPPKYEFDSEKLKSTLINFIIDHKKEIKKDFEEKDMKSCLINFRLLDNNSLDITDANKPQDYSITLYYYNINNHPINLEIYNIGGLLSKSGIIYKILIFNSFFVVALKKSKNKEEAILKVDEYLSQLEGNNINDFLSSHLKCYKNYLGIARSGYNKFVKMFSKPAIKTTLIMCLGGVGACVCFLFLGVVEMISFPILTILGMLLYLGWKNKKLQDYLVEKNSYNFEQIVQNIMEIFKEKKEKDKTKSLEDNNIFILSYDSNNKEIKDNEGATFFGYYLNLNRQKGKKLMQILNMDLILMIMKKRIYMIIIKKIFLI